MKHYFTDDEHSERVDNLASHLRRALYLLDLHGLGERQAAKDARAYLRRIGKEGTPLRQDAQ